jgi:hypothetical protein
MLWLLLAQIWADPVRMVNLAFALLMFAAAFGLNPRVVLVVSGLLYLALVVL